MITKSEINKLLKSYEKETLMNESIIRLQERMIKLQDKETKVLRKYLHESHEQDRKKFKNFHKSFNYRLRHWLIFNIPWVHKTISLYPDYVSVA